MKWLSLALALLALIGLAAGVSAAEQPPDEPAAAVPGPYAHLGGYAGMSAYPNAWLYAGPACHGCVGRNCALSEASCCDNVWAGYCDEKARRRAWLGQYITACGGAGFGGHCGKACGKGGDECCDEPAPCRHQRQTSCRRNRSTACCTSSVNGGAVIERSDTAPRDDADLAPPIPPST